MASQKLIPVSDLCVGKEAEYELGMRKQQGIDREVKVAAVD